MVFQPGQSGNPSGYNGERRKGTRIAFQAIRDAGYIDPLVNLAKIQHESQNEGIRASAAASLLGYCHPKLQSVPVPRFIERPIDVPDFNTTEDAEKFLVKITGLLARGELDLDFAESLTKMTVSWIQSQYAKQGLDIKLMAQQGGPADQTIKILGGLPELPGTNVTMPQLPGVNGVEASRLVEPSLLPPQTESPATDSVPTEGSS